MVSTYKRSCNKVYKDGQLSWHKPFYETEMHRLHESPTVWLTICTTIQFPSSLYSSFNFRIPLLTPHPQQKGKKKVPKLIIAPTQSLFSSIWSWQHIQCLLPWIFCVERTTMHWITRSHLPQDKIELLSLLNPVKH